MSWNMPYLVPGPLGSLSGGDFCAFRPELEANVAASPSADASRQEPGALSFVSSRPWCLSNAGRRARMD